MPHLWLRCSLRMIVAVLETGAGVRIAQLTPEELQVGMLVWNFQIKQQQLC